MEDNLVTGKEVSNNLLHMFFFMAFGNKTAFK